MKLDKISLIAACAVFTLGSCVRHSGEPMGRASLFNNKTGVDSEGFSFFKSVHEAAAYEVDLANRVGASATSPEVKKLASQVVETYQSILPELVEIATVEYVILPDPGALALESVSADSTTDSLSTAGTITVAEQDYIAHVQHKQAMILEQFNRASRNTNKQLRNFAAAKLPAVQELYALAGGEADHGAHH
ncbi:DUF4142 domain-containing protein [Parapedobacter lycopersici]|uniref:DUF4142 domain-containing protein n=1 Tax=Parapedobacter lycopersici TaxID=1864939 RepID=UPI00214DBC56|nr:DUF4142 domain-containing protein [Parapedobacter lycopersici]